MSTISGGQLHCSPIRILCTKSIDDVSRLLGEQLYSGDVPATGWGNVADDTSSLRLHTDSRPTPGRPAVYPPSESIRQPRLKARYYWDAADIRATRILGTDVDKCRTHMLNAVDLILVPEVEGKSYVGVVTTRVEKELSQYIEPGFRQSFAEVESSALVQFDVLDSIFQSDFYLWLLYRYDGESQLSEDLNLEIIRSVRSKDRLARGSSLTSGAEMDRADLAALVSGENQFGPAQFGIYDASIDLSLELELHPDGSFQIIVGSSDYDDRFERTVKGTKLVDDTAFVVLPKLRDAYESDSTWPSPGLGQLRERAVSVLQAHVTASGDNPE